MTSNLETFATKSIPSSYPEELPQNTFSRAGHDRDRGGPALGKDLSIVAPPIGICSQY